MAQRLRGRGVRVAELPFTSANRRELFAKLLDLIPRGQLTAAPHDELRAELLGLEVKSTLAGWRVDQKASGHDDHVIAVALAIHAALGGVRHAPLTEADEERARPEGAAGRGSYFDVDAGDPDPAEITQCEQSMLRAGIPQREIDDIKDGVTPDRRLAYLETRRDWDCLRERLIQARLDVMLEEDAEERRRGTCPRAR